MSINTPPPADLDAAKARNRSRLRKNRAKSTNPARTAVPLPVENTTGAQSTPSGAVGASPVAGENIAQVYRLHHAAALSFDHSQVMIHPAMRAGLTRQQILFAYEYVRDFNGAQAAIRAGYAESSAATGAGHLLAKPGIRACVDFLLTAELDACQDARLYTINELNHAKTLYAGLYPMAHIKAIELTGRHHGMWPRTVTHQAAPALADLLRQIAAGSPDLRGRGITIDQRAGDLPTPEDAEICADAPDEDNQDVDQNAPPHSHPLRITESAAQHGELSTDAVQHPSENDSHKAPTGFQPAEQEGLSVPVAHNVQSVK